VGRIELGFCICLVALLLLAIFHLGVKVGVKVGSRGEVKDMIELLDALKIDSWEQTVFRDRFKGALQWALDHKRKKDRNADPTPPSSP